MLTRAIIDFDDTLFNTKLLKDDIAAVFEEFGVSPQIFWESYKEACARGSGRNMYTFDRQLQIINKDYIFIDINQARQRLQALLEESARYVFPDALEFLSALKNRGLELWLLTLGEESFKSQKLRQTGLTPFFERVFLINEDKLTVLKPILTNPVPGHLFVNDKVNETKEILNYYPGLHAVLKTRGDVPLSEYENSGLPFFNTLSDIYKHLENLLEIRN